MEESAIASFASEFLDRSHASEVYPRDHMTRLARLAVSGDQGAAESATKAIFTSLVERLADSFEPTAVSLYNRAFAQLIQVCRKTEQGSALDRELASFGLISEEDLFARVERLRRVRKLDGLDMTRRNVKRVIVLSRVTLGADVAITSVALERLKREFPNAEVVLVGGRKAAELFGGDARLSFQQVDYHRTGTTVERLLNWLDVLGRVREATEDLKHGEYLILDPDSRLTQLGMLPVSSSEVRLGRCREESSDYLFFPSREYGSATSRSLSELASLWLDDLFGVREATLPRVNLRPCDWDVATVLMRGLKGRRKRPIITINFGIGENPMKRIGDEFERQLVSRLVQDGVRIILDKGSGEDEERRADEVIQSVMRIKRQGRGVEVLETDEEGLKNLANSDGLNADIITWRGRIGLLAAMIAESDLYIGYDSAGQHIASALGLPCIDVFAGFSSPRMLDRWRPVGRSEVRVIAVDTLNGDVNQSAILSDVLRDAREMLKSSEQ